MRNTQFDLINLLLSRVPNAGRSLVSFETLSCRPNVELHVWKWILGLPIAQLTAKEPVDDSRSLEMTRLKEVSFSSSILAREQAVLDRLTDFFTKHASRLSSICLGGSCNRFLEVISSNGGFLSKYLSKFTVTGPLEDSIDLHLLGRAIPTLECLVLDIINCENDLSVGFQNLKELTIREEEYDDEDPPPPSPLALKLIQSLSSTILAQLTTIRVFFGLTVEGDALYFFRLDGDWLLEFTRVFEKCTSLQALELGVGCIQLGLLAHILKCTGAKLKTLRVGNVLDPAMSFYKSTHGLKLPAFVHHGSVFKDANHYDDTSFLGDWESSSPSLSSSERATVSYTMKQRELDIINGLEDDDNALMGSGEASTANPAFRLRMWKNRAISVLHEYCPKLEWVQFWTQSRSGRWVAPLELERKGKEMKIVS
ncbi:UNVERIFIED_CONTAM: hypothetical protein HDU68_002205 [Siphonaria sp. JEL0065]|nr:hypothetical protein HDU68_002205 [Siphonaria sp. JEL0065]